MSWTPRGGTPVVFARLLSPVRKLLVVPSTCEELNRMPSALSALFPVSPEFASHFQEATL